jgi:hypothetical protein
MGAHQPIYTPYHKAPPFKSAERRWLKLRGVARLTEAIQGFHSRTEYGKIKTIWLLDDYAHTQHLIDPSVDAQTYAKYPLRKTNDLRREVLSPLSAEEALQLAIKLARDNQIPLNECLAREYIVRLGPAIFQLFVVELQEGAPSPEQPVGMENIYRVAAAVVSRRTIRHRRLGGFLAGNDPPFGSRVGPQSANCRALIG